LTGFTGENCDIRLAGFSIQEDESESKSSSGGLIAGICVTCILLVIALFIVVYYRKRLEKLKHEMAYVSYTAEAGPDQRHFDNPVYSSMPSNNKVKNFPNNLNNTKSNIEKAKLGCSVDDNSNTELNACAEASNNVYAELEEKKLKDPNFNPNIYHSIEDLKRIVDKKEPFYDEIKRKSVEGLLFFVIN
jgi:hypothetical protein